ncbi:MAG: Do family serine endopeptidase [Pseudomonadota bacterium]
MSNRFGVSSQALLAGFIGATAMAAFAFGPQLIAPAEARPITIEAPGNAPVSFADLVEQVSPAVVSVNVVSLRDRGANFEEFMERFRDMPGFDDFMDRRRNDDDEAPDQEEARSLGSGFFISSDGFIVTNNHVVDGATEIEIVLEDGRELVAEIVGTDASTDLAVLKAQSGGPFPYVEFATATEPRRGDWVVALGNPFGLGGTATAGIVSADGRNNSRMGRSSTYTDFLQIDAAINRGNSGGPTFDLNGRVIGVNTAIFSPTGGSVGIGFAIPAELAQQITQTLISDGRVSRGWLGVIIQDLTTDMADSQGLSDDEGAIVADVTNGSPAQQYGLERGDIILSVNGRDVEDSTQLTRVVGGLLAGSTNQFGILRDGERQTVSVIVGERPENAGAPSGDPDVDDQVTEDSTGPLGVSVAPLDNESRRSLMLDADEAGLVITEMEADSPLREVLIPTGAAILEINGRPLENQDDMERAIQAARDAGRDKVLMAVRVGEITTFRTVEIGAADD